MFLTFIWQFDYDVSCVDLFILLGIHWALWMCRLLLLDSSSNILFALFSLSPFLLRLSLCICWYAWWGPTGLWSSTNFLHSFLFTSSDQVISINITSVYWLFLLLVQMCYWARLVKFAFQLFYFFNARIFICFFKKLYLFVFFIWWDIFSHFPLLL